MTRYLVVYEKTKSGFSSYAPDLPGCVAAGKTRSECERNMATAMQMHLDGMREDGEKLPTPNAYAEILVVVGQRRRSASLG